MDGECGYGTGCAEEQGYRPYTEWSWVPHIFPYIDELSAAGVIDWGWNPGNAGNGYSANNLSVVATKYACMQCPTDTSVRTNWNENNACWTNQYSPRGHSRTSYAGNFGRGQLEAGSYTQDSASRVHGVFRYNRGMRTREIQDGLSHTLLVAEIVPGDVCSIRGTFAYDEGPVFMWNDGPNSLKPDLTRWCGKSDRDAGVAPCSSGPSEHGGVIEQLNMVQHAARSRHPNGLVVGICDGSVQFVSTDVALSVWQASGSPCGGEPVGSF